MMNDVVIISVNTNITSAHCNALFIYTNLIHQYYIHGTRTITGTEQIILE